LDLAVELFEEILDLIVVLFEEIFDLFVVLFEELPPNLFTGFLLRVGVLLKVGGGTVDFDGGGDGVSFGVSTPSDIAFLAFSFLLRADIISPIGLPADGGGLRSSVDSERFFSFIPCNAFAKPAPPPIPPPPPPLEGGGGGGGAGGPPPLGGGGGPPPIGGGGGAGGGPPPGGGGGPGGGAGVDGGTELAIGGTGGGGGTPAAG